jgi:hypothetical protein
MEVLVRIKIIAIVVPPAQVRSRRSHPLSLPKRLQHPVFIHIQKDFMILLKLLPQPPLQQLHLAITKQR